MKSGPGASMRTPAHGATVLPFMRVQRPVAVITYPASDEDSHDHPSLAVAWLYSQEEDKGQNAFRVWLRDSQDEVSHYHQGRGDIDFFI